MGVWLGDSTSTSASIHCAVTIDFYTTGLGGGKGGGIKIDR